jgi:hypothetical protein
MAITYSYQNYELKAAPIVGDLEQVITEIAYSYVGTDENGITSVYPGRTTLPTPNSEAFIPVGELTEELIIEWLKANADLEKMKQIINTHIERKSGIIYKGNTLPWSPVVEASVSELI